MIITSFNLIPCMSYLSDNEIIGSISVIFTNVSHFRIDKDPPSWQIPQQI